MSLRTLTLAALSTGALVSSASALVETQAGNLVATATGRVEYDSNIFANTTQKGDTIFTFVPELDFTRSKGLLQLDAAAGINLQKFADVSTADNESPFANALLNWKPDQAKTDGSLSASYLRNSSANDSVNQRTESDDYSLSGDVGQFVTEKLGYRLRTGYNRSDYITAGLSNTSNWRLGGDARYQYSPKLESFLSYGYRNTLIDGRSGGKADIKADDNLFSGGLEGELAPKLSGRVEAGVITRSFRNDYLSSQTGLLLKGSVTWAVKEGTSLRFFTGQDFEVSPSDQSVKKFSIGVDGNHQLTPKLSLGLSPSFEHSTYIGPGSRSDDAYIIRANGTYTFTPAISANAYVNYRDVSSSSTFATYDRTNIGVSLIAKF